MSGNTDADARSDAGDAAPERAIDPVLLNALADVVSGTDVLADDESRSVLSEALSDATTADERERFQEAIGRVQAEGESSGEPREAAATVVDAVRETLADRGATVTVDHEAPIPVDPTDAAVYDFATSQDPAMLADLDLPAAVAPHVADGASLVGEGDYAAAAEAFTRAVDEASGGDGSVTTRALAAWAHHWAGDDHAAIDFVEEALHFHADAWTPTQAGYSADPDPSFAQSEQFRDGKYAAMAVLRYTVDCPEGTSITPFLGRGDGAGGIEEWVELDGTDECTPIHRMGSHPVLRLRISGRVPAFPAMHSYYVGLGIVDFEVDELRAVYHLLLEGPLGEQVTETIRVELAD